MWWGKKKRYKIRYGENLYTQAEFIKKIYDDANQVSPHHQKEFIRDVLKQYGIKSYMTKTKEKTIAYITGVIFLIGLLAFSIFVPTPTEFQYIICRIILSFAAAACVAFVPGFLEVNVKTWIRATGAVAAFVVVYFWAPAGIGAYAN